MLGRARWLIIKLLPWITLATSTHAPHNYSLDKINSRCSMDKSVQKNGRRLANICIDNSVYILNGRSLGDLRTSYTCISPQGRSVIDYFLCPHDIMKEVATMAEQPFIQFSDHRPLLLKIHLPMDLSVRSKRSSFTTTTSRPEQHPSSQKRENQTRTHRYWDNDSVVNPAHGPPRWPSGKASAPRAEDPGFESRLRREFRGRVIPVTQKLALQWLPCQAPGVLASVLGLVGPVSVYCDGVR